MGTIQRRKTGARGYGARHQRLRRYWEPRVARGKVECGRCGRPIEPDEPWDLGHDDQDRSAYTGPEHQHCNRSAGARSSNRPARISRTRADWRRWVVTDADTQTEDAAHE